MTDLLGMIGRTILEAVLPSMGVVISGLLVAILKKQLAKHGIDLSEKQEQRLKDIVVEKIYATEEAARRQPMDSGEKAAMTINAVKAAADADPQIPNPPIAKVVEKVDATLSQVRAGYLPNPGLPGLGKR